ncbi:hypothetical protein B0I35DRAFT_110064 [Stachybotrys elegans]|uniref:Uncharacterized protein n=1 Tax=Stachybotrys elegans TaxID=80388 RepID=A0A8K0SJY8_9HYPO|nr:hypothetical protein B0I35DRAFT_110064 [Stachybotrys elegans]
MRWRPDIGRSLCRMSQPRQLWPTWPALITATHVPSGQKRVPGGERHQLSRQAPSPLSPLARVTTSTHALRSLVGSRGPWAVEETRPAANSHKARRRVAPRGPVSWFRQTMAVGREMKTASGHGGGCSDATLALWLKRDNNSRMAGKTKVIPHIRMLHPGSE